MSSARRGQKYLKHCIKGRVETTRSQKLSGERLWLRVRCCRGSMMPLLQSLGSWFNHVQPCLSLTTRCPPAALPRTTRRDSMMLSCHQTTATPGSQEVIPGPLSRAPPLALLLVADLQSGSPAAFLKESNWDDILLIPAHPANLITSVDSTPRSEVRLLPGPRPLAQHRAGLWQPLTSCTTPAREGLA